MKKSIKDYLHLYLGGIPLKAIMPNGTIVHIEGVCRFETNTYANYVIQDKRNPYNGTSGSYMVDGLRPILRPLNDMSEEESKKIGVWHDWARKTLIAIFWTPEMVVQALSMSFDLFGLIEAGLAIDATKEKVQESDTRDDER